MGKEPQCLPHMGLDVRNVSEVWLSGYNKYNGRIMLRDSAWNLVLEVEALSSVKKNR